MPRFAGQGESSGKETVTLKTLEDMGLFHFVKTSRDHIKIELQAAHCSKTLHTLLGVSKGIYLIM